MKKRYSSLLMALLLALTLTSCSKKKNNLTNSIMPINKQTFQSQEANALQKSRLSEYKAYRKILVIEKKMKKEVGIEIKVKRKLFRRNSRTIEIKYSVLANLTQLTKIKIYLEKYVISIKEFFKKYPSLSQGPTMIPVPEVAKNDRTILMDKLDIAKSTLVHIEERIRKKKNQEEVLQLCTEKVKKDFADKRQAIETKHAIKFVIKYDRSGDSYVVITIASNFYTDSSTEILTQTLSALDKFSDEMEGTTGSCTSNRYMHKEGMILQAMKKVIQRINSELSARNKEEEIARCQIITEPLVETAKAKLQEHNVTIKTEGNKKPYKYIMTADVELSSDNLNETIEAVKSFIEEMKVVMKSCKLAYLKDERNLLTTAYTLKKKLQNRR